MKIFIETKRLLLREIVATDIQDMFELDSDPKVHQYLGNQFIETLAEAESVIQYIRNQYEEDGIGRWAVIDKVSNEFMGWSGLKYEKEVRKDFAYYDLGYRFKPQYWGKGIATEAALVSVDYGFEELKLTEICGGADIENIGSNTVLQKAGLKYIETFDYEGVAHNWYKITKEDWEKGQ